MRVTITLNESLSKRLKKLIVERGLSEFINQCIQEHFDQKEKLSRFKKLEAAYSRANKIKDTFSELEMDDWPK